MQQLVPDAALIRADIVGAFMELDRCLSNLRVFEKRHIRAVGERKAGGDPAANSAEESLEHRRLREAAEDTGTDYRAEHNKILQLLDQIDRMLSRFV
jgi:hypothetical protein